MVHTAGHGRHNSPIMASSTWQCLYSRRPTAVWHLLLSRVAPLAHVQEPIPRSICLLLSTASDQNTDVLDNQIGTCSKENPKRRPYLPRHYKAPSNTRWCNLSAENGYSHFFQTHANTKKHTVDSQLRPSLGHGHSNWSSEGKDSSNENSMATTKEVIERIRCPTRSVSSQLAGLRQLEKTFLSKVTYARAMVMYGKALMKPTIH